MYSHHVCRLMRRINRLEARTVALGIGVYVAEYGSQPGKVRRYTGDGAELLAWETPDRPVAIDFDGRHVYTGCGNMRSGILAQYTPEGQLLRSVDLGFGPSGLAVLPDAIIVSGLWDNVVKAVDKASLQIIGDLPGGPFSGPADVTYVPARNEFYLVEYLGAYRVMVYDAAGRIFKSSWNAGGQAYCAVLFGELVYVSVTMADRIEVYTLAGERTRTLGNLAGVRGMSVAGDRLYVLLSSPYSQVHAFELPEFTPREVFPENALYQCHCLRTTGAALRQTAWKGYLGTGARQSLGLPDKGVRIPGDDALCEAFAGTGADLASNHIDDMRAALQKLAEFAGLPAFGWSRSGQRMAGTPCLDVDIEEVARAVETLEAQML